MLLFSDMQCGLSEIQISLSMEGVPNCAHCVNSMKHTSKEDRPYYSSSSPQAIINEHKTCISYKMLIDVISLSQTT